jgi:hypothetical protein
MVQVESTYLASKCKALSFDPVLGRKKKARAQYATIKVYQFILAFPKVSTP